MRVIIKNEKREKMLILDTITDIGFLKVFLLLKYAMYILFICTPLILMFFCFKDIADIVFNPSNANKSIKSIANRFIAALVVFLIPTIINYAFSLIEDFDDSKLIYYYNSILYIILLSNIVYILILIYIRKENLSSRFP